MDTNLRGRLRNTPLPSNSGDAPPAWRQLCLEIYRLLIPLTGRCLTIISKHHEGSNVRNVVT